MGLSRARASSDDKNRMTRSSRPGFKPFELQVAIVVVAFGVVMVTSALAAESLMLKRLRTGLKPGAAPWVASERRTDPPTQDATPQDGEVVFVDGD